MNIRKSIEDLATGNLADIAFLDSYLSTRLGAPSKEAYLSIRRSDSGQFAGMAVDSIELRTSDEDPSQAILVIDLKAPGPEASVTVKQYWPDAEFTPARPHAAASQAYWSFAQGQTKVSIGRPADQDRITSITFDRTH